MKTVHRLDAGTSGCLLLAKTASAAKQLATQFQTHQVKKTYLAIVDSGQRGWQHATNGELKAQMRTTPTGVELLSNAAETRRLTAHSSPYDLQANLSVCSARVRSCRQPASQRFLDVSVVERGRSSLLPARAPPRDREEAPATSNGVPSPCVANRGRFQVRLHWPTAAGTSSPQQLSRVLRESAVTMLVTHSC